MVWCVYKVVWCVDKVVWCGEVMVGEIQGRREEKSKAKKEVEGRRRRANEDEAKEEKIRGSCTIKQKYKR